MGTIEALKGN
jgi:hypothetical protein